MKKSGEAVTALREALIIDEVSPPAEGCGDCAIASDRYGNAANLRQLTEYIFDIANEDKKPREINEIVERNEDLAHTLQQAIHEFFPGVGALDKGSRDNLRFLADIGYETAVAFIESINRTIQSYEQLVDSCAGQGLRKVMLDRTKDENPVELTLCAGEIEVIKTNKSVKNVSISAHAKVLKLGNDTAA